MTRSRLGASSPKATARSGKTVLMKVSPARPATVLDPCPPQRRATLEDVRRVERAQRLDAVLHQDQAVPGLGLQAVGGFAIENAHIVDAGTAPQRERAGKAGDAAAENMNR